MNKKPYYITTAIAYTSGKPHIGNTYEIILADAIARFKRMEGYDVRFQTGTDEHGQKIEQNAEKAGVSPKEFVDGVAGEIRRIWDLVGTSYDRFIRTTDEDHEKAVQKIFKKLYDKGDIYKGQYEGLYCVPDESFFTPSQAPDGLCPDCGRPLVKANEEAYFFKMSKYADRLIEHINKHPEFIQPESRKNEMMNNFLLPGLQDLCVSRTSFKWGIPVDFDPRHVIYVWIDALSNYITGLGYDVDGSGELYQKYWPADLHLIGKDILRFHTIYWPIMLMALDVPLPKQVFGHPWLLQGGEKMSKSKGNVIYADDLVSIFGVDAVRYFVMHETPFENDGVITWELVIERFNSELANTLGNLVNRTISMSNKYLGGELKNTYVEEPVDAELKGVARKAITGVKTCMETLHVADAITEIFNLFKRCNKYIDETTPWILGKDPEKKDRLSTVLYNLAEGIMTGASLLAPFMPETSKKISESFHTELCDFEHLSGFGNVVKSGTKVVEKPEILFQRLDEKETMEKVKVIMDAQKAAAEAARAAEENASAGDAENTSSGPAETSADEAAPHPSASLTPSPQGEGEVNTEIDTLSEKKPEITFEDFGKMELRVGEVIACEAVPKSRKLLCSKVKVGNQVKQIVSGIHAWYTPEEMVGKKVMVLMNLKPAKLAGVLSEGMLLCADDGKGGACLMTPEKDVPNGAEIS